MGTTLFLGSKQGSSLHINSGIIPSKLFLGELGHGICGRKEGRAWPVCDELVDDPAVVVRIRLLLVQHHDEHQPKGGKVVCNRVSLVSQQQEERK